jgi:di/tricarboxylate transporter
VAEDTAGQLRKLRLKQRFGAVVVGILRAGRHLQSRLHERRIGQGDLLLVFGTDRAKEALRQSTDFAIIEGVDGKIYREGKAPYAIAVLGGLTAMFVSGVEPVTAAMLGAFAMVATGCLTARQAQLSVNWPILVFIAGTIALSRALFRTGADDVLGRALADSLGQVGPWALLAGMYFGTITLTELLSNNAVAVLMTPVALATASAAGIDERLLCVGVALAASNSFANPVGYKTNLLVFGPGGYRFRDFLRVGIGLDLLLGVVGVAALPWFFPF